MKVVIVNCFDTYEERIDLLHEYFASNGHSVTVIQSDFRHFKKEYRTEQKEDFVFISSEPYYKNMSFARLKSHYKFAKDAFKLIEKLKPDLLYAIVPPNSIAKFAASYKKKNPSIKLIYDLIDLWPETMPVGKIKKFPPFSFWQSMRDKSLQHADFVISECDLYRTVLKDLLVNIQSGTVYLAKKDILLEDSPVLSEDEVDLCYLGSINNIIDIQTIKELIREINNLKPTTLHIIGDGESKEHLINQIESTGAKVNYHGKIYDDKEKQKIFNQCHFGINIMKDEVCVGLTMKSIDYFRAGLPLINNISEDTLKIIKTKKAGFNCTRDNLREIAYKIIDTDVQSNVLLRKNAKEVFYNYFSYDTYVLKMDGVLMKLFRNE